MTKVNSHGREMKLELQYITDDILVYIQLSTRRIGTALNTDTKKILPIDLDVNILAFPNSALTTV